MWIINTILEGGDLETAIRKAVAMQAKRPSHLPPHGFLLTMLSRINNQVTPEVKSAIEVQVIEGS